MRDKDGNTIKKEKIQIYLDPYLLKDLRYLHKKEGPRSFRTKKRKNFSSFISGLLASHAHERMVCIRGLEHLEDFEDDLDS